MHIEPISGHIGAIITDIDLAGGLTTTEVAELRSAWLEHLVIFIRGQHISPAQQMAFAHQLGEPDTYPFLKGLPDYPQITEVLKREDEKVNFGGVWHTDTIYKEKPPMATMLYAIDIPPTGGDTLFTNQYAPYDSLSDALAQTVKTLRAVSRAGNKLVAATRSLRID